LGAALDGGSYYAVENLVIFTPLVLVAQVILAPSIFKLI
jgi:hypothetical protein